MDVENLAKELILKNMTPEQQQAVLDSVRSSVAQAKEVQKRKIGENVDLVVQALKKIESDICSRYDDVGNAIEKRVASIKDGRDGINGKDGLDGKDGRNGRDGAKGDKGERGQDGVDGSNGVDGVSVTSARIDFDGSLIITLSSGVELNVGEVVSADLAESIKVITNGGGTSQYVLDTLTSLQTQITNLIPSQTGNAGKVLTTNGSSLSWGSVAGGLSYQGTWNASTNTPTLASSTGTNGYYYIVATAGSTNLNGITSWNIGDWLMFNGSVWQKIDQSETLQSITSTDGSVTVTTTGSTADLSVAVAASTTNMVCYVRNTTGATLTKGTAVYISGATGQNPTVSKALATSDATSAQTLGLMTADLANNSNGYVTIIGLITNMNTSAYTDGEQLYLSPTTAGTLTATKPHAPDHLVYAAVVEHAHPTQGKLFVKVQNGYEMDELHNVSAQNPTNGQVLIYNESTSLWEKHTLTAGTGIGVSNGAGSITLALATGYGDSLNPYASKTANYVLAAPNGSAGAPTFRAIVAADIPTLNQNTTGTASNVTGTVAIANGGSGQTTAQLAMNAFAGAVTSGYYLRGNGTNVVMNTIQAADVPTLNQNTTGTASNVTGTVAIANGGTGQTTATLGFNALAPSQSTNSGKYLTTDGTNASWATVSAGASLSNDTSTTSNLYPLFAAATSGTPTTVYTSNAKYLYKPSTGELQATALVATNGIVVNSQTIASDYTIASGNNGMSAGTVSVNSGITVTISTGSVWTVV